LHAKVGHCQAIYTKSPVTYVTGLFYVRKIRGVYKVVVTLSPVWIHLTIVVGLPCLVLHLIAVWS